ncbi:MAG: hypothetical protein JNK04_08330, partial [Myxococcales bacterium]|nr:hypothetical protein [Myxococcales bacterium]
TLGPDGEADLELQGDAKTAMIASFATAGALAAAGVVLLAVMPSADSDPPRVSLAVGPGGVRLLGVF